MRRVKALVTKEFYQIIRDPSSLLISIVLPMLLLFIYGFGISLDYKHLQIGLVLEDTAPDAISFSKALIDSEYFDVEVARDRPTIERQISTGKLHGMVVVPSYFSSFRQRTDQVAPIQVIADGSDPNTANFVQNYVLGAFQNWLVQEKISSDWDDVPLVQLEPRFWFNEDLESRHFIIPGSLAIIMTLIGTLLTSLVIAREWERGTMESLLATPLKAWEIVVSKLISYFALGMIAFICSTAVAALVYQIPLRGSWLLLLASAATFLIGALGLGLLLSTGLKNQFAASQAAIVVAFLPAYMLSGFLFEISTMPLPIRLITYVIPARYFVSCLQTLFLAGTVWKLVLKSMAIMGLMGCIVLFLTVKKTVKRLD
jgi:ABC-2 type transport system permease protein